MRSLIWNKAKTAKINDKQCLNKNNSLVFNCNKIAHESAYS